MEYKKYYDFAMELFNNSQKTENNSSLMLTKPLTKDFPAYNNYFEPKTKDKSRKNER